MQSAESGDDFLHWVACTSSFSFSDAHVAHESRLLHEQFRAPRLEDVDPNHIFNKCIYRIFLFIKISQTDTIMTAKHESCTVYL